MFYQFDPIEQGRQLLPLLLRKPRIFGLLNAMLQPLRELTEQFDAFRASANERMKINGQVIYIEHALNSRYYLERGEIWIEDTPGVVNNFIDAYGPDTMAVYAETDSKVTHLYAEGEGKPDGDYIVHIPDFLEYDIETIRAILEQNRPAGKQYVINIYQYGNG